LAFAVQTGGSALGPIGVILGSWLVLGAAFEIWQRAGKANKIARLKGLPRADWGKAVAHAGMGITTFGIAAMLAWQIEDIRIAQIGDRFEVGQHQVELIDVREVDGPNYISTMAEMKLYRGGREVAHLFPEKRVYPVANMPTTEAAISNGILRDLYVVIGDPQNDGGWAVRTYIKPFANWIWAGAIIMALGGTLSLTDRRMRVAGGQRSKAVTS